MEYKHNNILDSKNGQENEPKRPVWVDISFDNFVSLNPSLAIIKEYLPTRLSDSVYPRQKEIEISIPSTYKEHGYGGLLYSLIKCIKPSQVVELGVYKGFSLLAIAAALQDNSKGNIVGFDLFEDYEYRHDSFDKVSGRIKKFGFENVASIQKADFAEVYRNFEGLDVLHVDISNNGDIYRSIFEKWSSKVKKLIILEGGSKERDQVPWMIRYQKPSIGQALHDIQKEYLEWEVNVLNPFPSMTIAVKKEM